ncbi:YhcN/YlaJ family sporulation lipoprotein [Virgibacillus siamensis]|uniref:YhcN/YlaJ family sporulation lipoprotein n=1 Tax=Virgibacillus siamensis TaxID=480071 RepID=UPI00158898DC|nr:YhcN/YlaJ family sporulation lipoprotein [Virgibacillus siamensis]
MRFAKIFCLLLCGVFLVACSENRDSATDSHDQLNSDPIHYETDKEHNDRIDDHPENIAEKGGYPQSDRDRLNVGDEDAKTDLYTNEWTMSISKHLKQRKDVKQAQVAATDDKIVVGVLVNEYAQKGMKKKIKAEVEQMVPGRKVVVYTDRIYWDKMRDEDAEPDQLNGDMEEFLDEFFNRERD